MQESNKAKGDITAIQKSASADLSALISCVHSKVRALKRELVAEG